MQLSNVAVSSKTSHSSPSPLPTPSPHDQPFGNGVGSQTPRMPPPMSQYQPYPGNIPSSFKSGLLETAGSNLVQQCQNTTPSGLSLLLANRRAELISPSSREEPIPSSPDPSLSPVPRHRGERVDPITSPPFVHTLSQTHYPEGPQLSEEALLLAQGVVPEASYSSVEAGPSHPPVKPGFRFQLVATSETACDRSGELLATCVRSLPAVLLGALLNILDGISCELSRGHAWSHLMWCLSDGLIIFPTSGIFADLGGLGVSMFFVS